MGYSCACIILNYNDAETTKALVQRIINYKAFQFIVVVDNKSTDNSFETLKTLASSHVKVIETDCNGGYGYGNNAGVRYAYYELDCKYALIANPDVEFEDETIIALIQKLESEHNVAIVAPTQLDRKGEVIADRAWRVPSTLQYIISAEYLVGKYLKPLQYNSNYFNSEYVEVGCVPGSLLLVSISAFLNVGGYDQNIFLYGEETTLGIKMKNAGYLTLLNTKSKYFHMHSVSINRTISSVRKQRKLTLTSRYYIINKYFEANFIELALTRIVHFISLFEYGLMELIRRKV